MMPERAIDEELTLRISRNDLGQIIDGVDVLIEQWDATAEFLETGIAPEDVCIREASSVRECRAIADRYRSIRRRLRAQVSP
jgi:hypothetical protein